MPKYLTTIEHVVSYLDREIKKLERERDQLIHIQDLDPDSNVFLNGQIHSLEKLKDKISLRKIDQCLEKERIRKFNAKSKDAMISQG